MSQAQPIVATEILARNIVPAGRALAHFALAQGRLPRFTVTCSRYVPTWTEVRSGVMVCVLLTNKNSSREDVNHADDTHRCDPVLAHGGLDRRDGPKRRQHGQAP